MHTLLCLTLVMVLDDRFRVVSLRHRESGYEFLSAPAAPTGPWQLGLMRPVCYRDPLPPVRIPDAPYEGHEWWVNRHEYRADLELDSDAAPVPEITAGADACEARWQVPVDGGVATVTLRVDGGARDSFAWTCRVALPPEWALKRLTYPRLRGVGDPAAPDDDALLIPEGWGVLRHNPLEDQTQLTGQYPSNTTWCRMLAWLHGDRGLYLAVHDPEINHIGLDAQYVDGAAPAPWEIERWHLPDGKATRRGLDRRTLATRLAAGGQPSMQLRVNHWPGMAAEWSSPYPVLLQGFTGDWFTASQLHRAWAVQQRWCRRGPLATRTDASATLASLDLWFMRYGFPAGSQTPRPPQEFLQAMGRLQDYFDMPFGVHWYHWHNFSWHTSFPSHAPAVPGFARAVRDLQARGIVVMPYCQGRLLYRDRPGLEKERAHASIQANGQPYLEMYTPQDDWPLALCPGDAWSRAAWVKAARMLWQDYGVDAVYFDQISGMPPSLCYHAGHGHPPGGGTHYWQGYDRALAEMAPLIAENPRRFLVSELFSDALLDRFDAFLSFVPPVEDNVPLFSAIYGGYSTAIGRHTPGEVLAHPQLFILCQGEQFLFGGQLGWVNDDILNYPAAASTLRDLARLRSRLHDFLHLGTMRPNFPLEGAPRLGLSLPGYLCGRPRAVRLQRPAVRQTAWTAPDGRTLVLLLNERNTRAAVTLRVPDGAWQQWRLGSDTPQTLTAADGALAVTLPPLGAVALVAETAE